jgi:hypothetical protein
VHHATLGHNQTSIEGIPMSTTPPPGHPISLGLLWRKESSDFYTARSRPQWG